MWIEKLNYLSEVFFVFIGKYRGLTAKSGQVEN